MQLVQQNKEFLSIFAQLKPTNLRVTGRLRINIRSPWPHSHGLLSISKLIL